MSRLRLINGKKGSPIYILLVVMAGIVALSFCWFIIVNKTQGVERKLGENQFALLEVYQFGEEFRLYVEQAGRYAAYYTIHSLAGAAGTDAGSECGVFNDYQLWNLKDKDCFPATDSIKESFANQFSNVMDEYMQLYLTPPDQLDYQLDFIKINPLTIRAIPYNKLDFAISKSNPKNIIHPNIKAITLGESLDPQVIQQKIQEHEAELPLTSPAPGGTP